MPKKYKIAIFTKTDWNEDPRIRHQLTRLLHSYGHEIVFFERSAFNQLSIFKHVEEGVNFVKHFELIHHQLRPFNFLVKLNQMVAKYFLKKNIKEENIDLIINFNYDYSFFKEVFPEKKIVTIINDDFVAQAKFWMEGSIFKQLKATCIISDLVFVVSYPLYEQLEKFNKNTHIFLPWAENSYRKPGVTLERDVVLWWGFIDHRIDWDVIEYLLKNNVKLRFIGNIQSKIRPIIKRCKKYDNFELLAAMPLDKLSLKDVACSILAYDKNREEMKVVTVNNRVFQLLSYGIPLVYSDLPNLIKAPSNVITKCKTNEDYLKSIQKFSNIFDMCQKEIEEFLLKHYADIRYRYLMQKIEEINIDD